MESNGTRVRRLALLALVIIAMLLVQVAVTVAHEPTPVSPSPTAGPETANKNDAANPAGEDDPLAGSSDVPAPGSKNDFADPLFDESAAEPPAMPLEPGGKNAASDAEVVSAASDAPMPLTAGDPFVTCGASRNLNWTTTGSSFAVVRQCSFSAPQNGWVHIVANGSLGRQNGEYEAQFRLGIDSTTGEGDTDRWVNVYNDSGDGTDRSVALSVLKPVTAGMRSFYFLGRRFSGTGTVLVYDPTLTVTFIPASGTPLRTCGASGNLNWTTAGSSFAVARQCSLAVPRDGWVYLVADGSPGRQNGEYEAQFRLGINNTTGADDTDRWVNIYSDTGDGTDKSVALSVLKPITAGTHTFSLLGRRYSGSGTVLVYDPTLTAIFIPSPGAVAPTCGVSGNLTWTTTGSSFAVIRQCTLAVPQDSWAFIIATGSVARLNGPYEAQFRLGINKTTGEADTDRWVNVYDDSRDGTDETLALSVLRPLNAGTYTFSLLGRRYSGSGTVRVYDPTLIVITTGARHYLPVVAGPSS